MIESTTLPIQMPIEIQWTVAALSPALSVAFWAAITSGRRRQVARVAALAGWFFGVFWLAVIDGQLNGASWATQIPRTWLAYVMFPFIPFIGIGWWTLFLPTFNSLFYALLASALPRRLRSRKSVGNPDLM